jgi:hypothetical protein
VKPQERVHTDEDHSAIACPGYVHFCTGVVCVRCSDYVVRRSGWHDPGAHANNDFIGTLFGGPQIGGYFGSQILFNAAPGSTLTIDFFGAEAGYVNNFLYSGSTVFTHNGGLNIASSLNAPKATFSTTIGGSGTLPFKFKVNSGAGSVTNGTNPNDFAGLSLGPNFFATCNPFSQSPGAGGTSCNSVYLFLDDGGAGRTMTTTTSSCASRLPRSRSRPRSLPVSQVSDSSSFVAEVSPVDLS